MKQETKDAINRVLEVLENSGIKFTDFLKDIRVVSDILKKLPEMEQALASGGLVKDDKGNWLKNGDKVKYRDKRNDELHIGTVDFDQVNLSWYLITDDGDFPFLARDYGMITYFEKA